MTARALVNITIRISPELYDALVEEKRVNGTAISKQIVDTIQEKYNHERYPTMYSTTED
jgi:hypothetical protein